MAGFEDFDSEDWRETLAELRLMVAGAGFGDWDATAAVALDEDVEERVDPRQQLQRYAQNFTSFLKVRSAWNLGRMREDMGRLLRDVEGRPVLEAVVGDDRTVDVDDILGGPTTDGLIEEMNAFLAAMNFDPPPGYFDDEGEDA